MSGGKRRIRVKQVRSAIGTLANQRASLREGLETFTDRRVERYWQLMGTINGWPPFEPTVPAFEWLIAALRAHG